MLLRFIGTDGFMGLEKDKIYTCAIYTMRGYVWVRWVGNVYSWEYPYRSYKDLFKNWEEVDEV